jgi:choline dehydrogenase-like flavoprotein
VPGPALTAALGASTTAVVHASDPHDAVVIGTGAAGGLAALLLIEAGLRVLVLEAGAAGASSNMNTIEPDQARQPIQSQCYAWKFAPQAFVDDLDCPYSTPPDRPFLWLRARQLGGRMVIPGHGRQYYRFAPTVFNPVDGLSPQWPLSIAELEPWYGRVERRLGLFGMHDGVPWLPDSELSHVLSLTPEETELKTAINARWPAARPILGRFAEPFDGLEAAASTGRLLIRTDAVVKEIEVNALGHVCGVVWIDKQTGKQKRARTQLVFLCASTLESTRLLLLSRSGRNPDGLGASSGALGRYLMDHVCVRGSGTAPPMSVTTSLEDGRCLYLPRFDSRQLPARFASRGFGVQVYRLPIDEERSYFSATSFGEMVPRAENRVDLNSERVDAWGIPILQIDCIHGPSELQRAQGQIIALRELGELDGINLSVDGALPPGGAIHESGTARMGADRDDSVLDPYNQCWEAQGLYVTDAACFPSQGSQNPTLTILALTARACEHALMTGRGNGNN